MIYVDDLFDVLTTDPWGYPNACHLWADTEAELLAFAAEIGLRAAWLQRSSRPGRLPPVLSTLLLAVWMVTSDALLSR